jgi:hypothetical protein
VLNFAIASAGVLDLDDDDSKAHLYLGCGQTDASIGVKGLPHVRDKLIELCRPKVFGGIGCCGNS